MTDPANMTTCTSFKAECDRRFDAGDGVSTDAPHLAECAACADYAARLAAIQRAMSRMPLEVPREGFSRALKARLEEERAQAEDSYWWIGASALAFCALFVAVSWYAAGAINPIYWLDQVPEISLWGYFDEMTRAGSLDWARDYWSTLTAPLVKLASPGLWALAVAALIVLVSVNMAEAFRLRGATLHRRS